MLVTRTAQFCSAISAHADTQTFTQDILADRYTKKLGVQFVLYTYECAHFNRQIISILVGIFFRNVVMLVELMQTYVPP